MSLSVQPKWVTWVARVVLAAWFWFLLAGGIHLIGDVPWRESAAEALRIVGGALACTVVAFVIVGGTVLLIGVATDWQ